MSKFTPQEWLAVYMMQVGQVDGNTGPWFYWGTLETWSPGNGESQDPPQHSQLLGNIWRDLCGHGELEFRQEWHAKYNAASHGGDGDEPTEKARAALFALHEEYPLAAEWINIFLEHGMHRTRRER